MTSTPEHPSLVFEARVSASESQDESADRPSAEPSPEAEKKRGLRSWRPRRSRISPVAAERVKAQRQRALLCVDNVSVSFDGFKALTDLTFILNDGELRCIIGPNGAGKTTLMDVITGKTKPDAGSVFFVEDLEELTLLAEHEIARRGVGRKFQRPTVFPEHTVIENLELSLAASKGILKTLFGRWTKAERERIDEILEIIGLADTGRRLAGTLAHGQKQWLEIGMLLGQDPRVLLVDEPVAGMTHQEAEHTARLLRSLAGKHTVVVIEHDMDFVRSVATNIVTVLHEGKILAEGSMNDMQHDPRVVEVYLGA